MSKISSEEWLQISNELERFHAIFYKIWSVGKPIFKNEIETAAIEFDSHGDYIQFSFNPSFWSKLSLDGKLFVICHEMLHIILNHGKRSKNIHSSNKICANICLDIVVNHSLVNNFSFNKEKIELSIQNALQTKNSDKPNVLCWVEDVFPKCNLPEDECFEFYLNKYKNIYGDGHPNQANLSNNGCLDDHSCFFDKNSENFLSNISSELNEEELKTLSKVLEKQENTNSGKQFTGWWIKLQKSKNKKKKKWETVIKSWERKNVSDNYGFAEQWLRKSRRYTSISDDLFLPSEIETYQKTIEENMIDVFFYLDTSGSCFEYKNRFFDCASSLDTNRFNVRLFCFDTIVKETTLKSKKIYGGGGTLFTIIQRHVKAEIHKKNKRHPVIFVLTDGYGDTITVEKPEKWHWFITKGGTKIWIDKRCCFYNLEDYE